MQANGEHRASEARALAAAVLPLGALIAIGGCAGQLAKQTPATSAATPATAAAPDGDGGPAIASRSQLRAPRSLMEVPLTTLAGDSVKLADLGGGHVTVIAVWATWCRPCLQELPLLDAVKRRYANDPKVHVVAVSIDEVDSEEALGKVQETVDRLGVKLPVYVDQTGKLARQLMGTIQSVPLLAILDRDLYMMRERGFDSSTNPSSYIAAKSALIELARKGELPSDPSTPSDPQTGALLAALRANLKRAYPELTEERIEELLQNLEERMQYHRPRDQ